MQNIYYEFFLEDTERVERGEGAAAADDQGQPRLRGQTGRHPQAETQIKDKGNNEFPVRIEEEMVWSGPTIIVIPNNILFCYF